MRKIRRAHNRIIQRSLISPTGNITGILTAAKTGDVEDDELETMNRTALLELVAKDIVSRKGPVSSRKSEKSN